MRFRSLSFEYKTLHVLYALYHRHDMTCVRITVRAVLSYEASELRRGRSYNPVLSNVRVEAYS
jgi:hypothetical protein